MEDMANAILGGWITSSDEGKKAVRMVALRIDCKSGQSVSSGGTIGQ